MDRVLAALLALLVAGVSACSGEDGAEPATDGRVLVDGSSIVVVAAGDPDDPPVVFLHGAAYTHADWIELGSLEAVASGGGYAVAVDLPGAGGSDTWAGDRAEFLSRLLAALGLGPAVVVAPSASGTYALPHLLAHPDEVAGLVPVAPSGATDFAWPDDAPPPPPVVAVWGDGDRPATGEAMVARIPGARLEILPDAGHAAYLDQPDRFHEILLALL